MRQPRTNIRQPITSTRRPTMRTTRRTTSMVSSATAHPCSTSAGDIGALLLYTSEALEGQEIEVSRTSEPEPADPHRGPPTHRRRPNLLGRCLRAAARGRLPGVGRRPLSRPVVQHHRWRSHRARLEIAHRADSAGHANEGSTPCHGAGPLSRRRLPVQGLAPPDNGDLPSMWAIVVGSPQRPSRGADMKTRHQIIRRTAATASIVLAVGALGTLPASASHGGGARAQRALLEELDLEDRGQRGGRTDRGRGRGRQQRLADRPGPGASCTTAVSPRTARLSPTRRAARSRSGGCW